LWQLVLAVERKAKAILDWSNWRRWHQAWARYHHYRRRQREAAAAASEGLAERAPDVTEALGRRLGAAAEEAAAAASEGLAERASDVTEALWRRLEPLLAGKRMGRPYSQERRLVLEAIVYVMQTNCGWEHLPSRYPPGHTVHSQLTDWRKSGIWDSIWSGLDQPYPTG
jgi:hypothetical protein